jgi:hypothetical protein
MLAVAALALAAPLASPVSDYRRFTKVKDYIAKVSWTMKPMKHTDNGTDYELELGCESTFILRQQPDLKTRWNFLEGSEKTKFFHKGKTTAEGLKQTLDLNETKGIGGSLDIEGKGYLLMVGYGTKQRNIRISNGVTEDTFAPIVSSIATPSLLEMVAQKPLPLPATGLVLKGKSKSKQHMAFPFEGETMPAVVLDFTWEIKPK